MSRFEWCFPDDGSGVVNLDYVVSVRVAFEPLEDGGGWVTWVGKMHDGSSINLANIGVVRTTAERYEMEAEAAAGLKERVEEWNGRTPP